MRHASKIRPLDEAIRLIPDGAVLALAGGGRGRQPMAAVRELIRQERRGLHVAACQGGVALDLLVACGCTASVETEAADRFHAASLGVPFLPRPNGGDGWTAVQAIHPDVAIIHAHRADAAGNVQLAPEPGDDGLDAATGRSARTVIVTVEQIVSAATIARHAAQTILRGAEVACVVEAPFGAHPCGCDPLYWHDDAYLDRLLAGAADLDAAGDHWAYLDRVGARALMAISRNRAAR